MAALIEDTAALPAASGVPNSDSLTQALYGNGPAPYPTSASSVGEAIKSRMPDLVKGAGMVGRGANAPLTNQTEIMNKSAQAALDIRMATRQGFVNKAATTRSLNPDFLNQFGALRTALEQPSMIESMAAMMAPHLKLAAPDIVRSFTAGNLGIGSVA